MRRSRVLNFRASTSRSRRRVAGSSSFSFVGGTWWTLRLVLGRVSPSPSVGPAEIEAVGCLSVGNWLFLAGPFFLSGDCCCFPLLRAFPALGQEAARSPLFSRRFQTYSPELSLLDLAGA